MSKATSRSVNRSIIVAVILTAIIAGSVVGGAVYYIFVLQPAPDQQAATTPKPALQKFKASGWSATSELSFLVMDAGKDKGIWANNGLDTEFVLLPGGLTTLAADIKDQVVSGIKIGFAIK